MAPKLTTKLDLFSFVHALPQERGGDITDMKSTQNKGTHMTERNERYQMNLIESEKDLLHVHLRATLTPEHPQELREILHRLDKGDLIELDPE